jgi:hypothetical protein
MWLAESILKIGIRRTEARLQSSSQLAWFSTPSVIGDVPVYVAFPSL